MKKKNRLLRKFHNMKIGNKILLSLLLVSIIPILVIQLVGYTFNSTVLKNKIDTLMVDNLISLSDRVELTMDIYRNLVYQLYVDDEIIENVNTLIDDEAQNQEIAFHMIYNRLQQAKNSVKGIRSISIICSNGRSVTYDAETGSSIENLWSDFGDMRGIQPYVDVQDMPGMLVTPTQRFEEYGKRKYYFHISKCMYDYKNMEKGSIATIVMSIDESVIQNICTVSIQKEEQEYNINFIMDGDNHIISYPDSFFTGIRMNPELDIPEFVKLTGLLTDKDLAVNRYEDEKTGWVYINVYDKDYMMRDLKNSQMIFIGITLAAILFACLLILYIVKELEMSVALIIGGIKKVQQGQLDVVVELDSQDELGQIASNFNSMTEKVRNLIREVTKAKDEQKNAEIRALEAQINPHFLYNTLDSINWMAIEKEEYEISRMIRNLGVILRYSVNKSNHMVTIEEMADWLEKYIALQQMRFNQNFRYELNVSEDAKKIKIYKLLLQPFVENAIIHGFKGIDGGGVLRIDAFLSEDGERLSIIIEDNGKGMRKEQTDVYNDREQAILDSGESIGLHNAFARMNMYYGVGAVWKVNSMEGMGTVITLNLPINEERRGEVCES